MASMPTSASNKMWEDDVRSLLPAGFSEFREELERKKESRPLPRLDRSDLWARRGTRAHSKESHDSDTDSVATNSTATEKLAPV
mmetsp:Transcript_6370/g.17742  ORF Transcript_6370/g.17742 Transcript_6370/m.17742 type:complete len:84 (+) Transcript_6370:70-321(+)